ncbi:MAG: PIG-L family deacetylase [Candidatus Bathyarchaeota archaeon]|nr:PIG-L family deacetylase [Candidatus Bathyarchaeum sp.]
MDKPIVVFSPHPDDETLGCGGTIAKKLSENYQVYIVLLTDGRHAFSNCLDLNSDITPDAIVKIRKKEVIDATTVLGVPVENLVFLDFEDRMLKEHETVAEQKITEILKKHSPVEVYFPFMRDSHPDHRAANRIIRRCLQNLKLTSIRYQYSVMHRFLNFGPRIERLIDVYKDCIADVDISEYLSLKKKAVKQFTSELSVVLNNSKKPVVENVDRYFKNTERFYIDKS